MSSKKIIIIDYKMGNLGSVFNAFRFLKYDVEVSDQPEKLKESMGLVLPGVGAFGDAMRNLGSAGLAEVIRQEIEKGKPYLGICLGYQLLFEGSEEDERIAGLGIIKGRVIRFRTKEMKVPHIGWNQARKLRDDPVLFNVNNDSYFYFVHSFYPVPKEGSVVLCETEYGDTFASGISRENLFAFQFHPEKSQDDGLKILKNFGEYCVDHSSH